MVIGIKLITNIGMITNVQTVANLGENMFNKDEIKETIENILIDIECIPTYDTDWRGEMEWSEDGTYMYAVYIDDIKDKIKQLISELE
jgi:hypothetical protein